MKKFSLVVLLVAVAISSFGQSTTNTSGVTEKQLEEWKRKSRLNKDIGLFGICIGAVGLGAGGAILLTNSGSNGDLDAQIFGGVLMVVGGVFTVASVPFLVISQSYHKKIQKVELSFSNKFIQLPVAINPRMRSQPAVTLSIPLKR